MNMRFQVKKQLLLLETFVKIKKKGQLIIYF